MIVVKKLENLAQKKNCTSARLALAWLSGLLKRNGMPKIVSILGAAPIGHAIENGKAGKVELHEGTTGIDQVLATCEVAGNRYHPAGMKSSNDQGPHFVCSDG